MINYAARRPLRMLLLIASVTTVLLLTCVRVTQIRSDTDLQRVHTEQVGKLRYELWANGELQVRHAEDPMMHAIGLRMSIADWRTMQDELGEVIYGLEN